MKTIRIIIIILIIIICGQFYLLIRQTKVERYIKHMIQRQQENAPLEYISGMTTSVNVAEKNIFRVLSQTKWSLQHLESCIKLMESERGLKPISSDRGKNYRHRTFSMEPIKKKKTLPFVSPYKEPEHKKSDDSKESEIRKLICQFNLQQVALACAMYGFDTKIENYHQRLVRLDPNAP